MTKEQRFLLESVISDMIVEAETAEGQPSQALINLFLSYFAGVNSDCVQRANDAAAAGATARECIAILLDPSCQAEGAQAAEGFDTLSGILADPGAALRKLLIGTAVIVILVIIYKIVKKFRKNRKFYQAKIAGLKKLSIDSKVDFEEVKKAAEGSGMADVPVTGEAEKGVSDLSGASQDLTQEEIDALRSVDQSFIAIKTCKRSSKCIEMEISNLIGDTPVLVSEIEFTAKGWRKESNIKKPTFMKTITVTNTCADWDDMVYADQTTTLGIPVDSKVIDFLSLDRAYKELGTIVKTLPTGEQVPSPSYITFIPKYVYVIPYKDDGSRGAVQRWNVKYLPGPNRYRSSALEAPV